MEDKQLYAIIIQLQQKVSTLEDRVNKLESPFKPPNHNGVKDKKQSNLHLDETDLVLFNNLRTWRYNVSKTKSIPVHYVTSNRTLTELAFNKPKNKVDAMKCYDVGQMFVDSYWTDISKIIETHV